MTGEPGSQLPGWPGSPVPVYRLPGARRHTPWSWNEHQCLDTTATTGSPITNNHIQTVTIAAPNHTERTYDATTIKVSNPRRRQKKPRVGEPYTTPDFKIRSSRSNSGWPLKKKKYYFAKYNVRVVMFMRKCPMLDDPASLRDTYCDKQKGMKRK